MTGKHLNFIKNRKQNRNAQSHMQDTAVWQNGGCRSSKTLLRLNKLF